MYYYECIHEDAICAIAIIPVSKLSPNWHQTRSKIGDKSGAICVSNKLVYITDSKLAAKTEQILYSTTPILRDNMQGLLGFCSQFIVRQRYARFARFLLPICRQVT